MKMKKLLAATMAATMILSSMVSSLVASAATTLKGTITAATKTAESETVVVPVTIDFDGDVVAPHGMFTITAGDAVFAGAELVGANDKYLIGTTTGGEPNYSLWIEVNNNTILVESKLEYTVADVDTIVINCTFTNVTKNETVVIDDISATNYDEADWDQVEANNGAINFHTHDYKAVVTEPTCTEAGFTTYTCDCGDTYTDDETDALGHDYDSVIDPDATCGTDGVETFTCANCGDTYTETIGATGNHNYVDGVCDVCGAEDPDYEPPVADPVFLGTVYDVTGGATGGYQLNGKATFGFENATAKEYGVLFYRAAAFDPNNISFENASLTKSSGTKTSDTMSVTGFAFEFIVEKFVFVPYGVDTDGNYYYGEAVHYSYVDYLKTRETNTAAIGTKARAMLNAYYAIYGAPYDGYVYTGPDAFEYDGPYVATNPRGKIADGEYAFVPTFTGSTKNNPINIKGDFSAYDGPAAQEYGFMVMRESSYKVGDTISIEKAALSAPLGNKGASAKSISSFANLGESFVFVLYIKDVNGDYHYGDVWQSSYADYLVEKLNAGVPSASSTAKTTALKADLLLKADALVFNRTLHTKG